MEPLLLDHADFVTAQKAGQVRCLVNKRLALTVCDSSRVPKGWRTTQDVCRGVGCLIILAGIASLFFLTLWKGILCVVVCVIVSSAWHGSLMQTAAQNVIELALEDAGFYEVMIQQGVLSVYEATKN